MTIAWPSVITPNPERLSVIHVSSRHFLKIILLNKVLDLKNGILTVMDMAVILAEEKCSPCQPTPVLKLGGNNLFQHGQ